MLSLSPQPLPASLPASLLAPVSATASGVGGDFAATLADLVGAERDDTAPVIAGLTGPGLPAERQLVAAPGKPLPPPTGEAPTIEALIGERPDPALAWLDVAPLAAPRRASATEIARATPGAVGIETPARANDAIEETLPEAPIEPSADVEPRVGSRARPSGVIDRKPVQTPTRPVRALSADAPVAPSVTAPIERAAVEVVTPLVISTVKAKPQATVEPDSDATEDRPDAAASVFLSPATIPSVIQPVVIAPPLPAARLAPAARDLVALPLAVTAPPFRSGLTVDVPATIDPARDAPAAPPIAAQFLLSRSEPGQAITAPPVPAASGPALTASPVAAAAAPGPAPFVVRGTQPDAAAPIPIAIASVAPLPAQPLIGVPLPAAQAFAAAIAAVAAPPKLIVADEASPVVTLFRAPITADIVPTRVDAAAPGQSVIDTGREDWTRALIDRIDSVRDVADARDTRIRLLPDALGKIDVALRQEGDTLHVHFTAEMPATRVLLAEAQPRLAELADARGLRLGQGSVDAGATGQSAGQSMGQDARRSQAAPAPASHRSTTTSAPDGADSDHRIA